MMRVIAFKGRLAILDVVQICNFDIWKKILKIQVSYFIPLRY